MVGLITLAKLRKQAKPKNRLEKTTNHKNRIDTLQLVLFIDIPWSLEPTWTSIAAVPGHATLSTAVAYLLSFKWAKTYLKKAAIDHVPPMVTRSGTASPVRPIAVS